MSQLTHEAQQKEHTLIQLQNKKAEIEEKVRLMRPSTLSADILEEQARSVLGYKRQDEFIVFSE